MSFPCLPCCAEGCTFCGDRLTAVFTGLMGGACLETYEWPMGLICVTDLGGGEILYRWEAFADGGIGGPISCLDFNLVQVSAQCDTVVGGWALVAQVNGITVFGASGPGGFPTSVPIPNTSGSGSATVVCGGSWGVCCDTDFNTCYGCQTVCGQPGGMGPDQCTILLGASFSAVYQGDHSTCATDPCGFGPC